MEDIQVKLKESIENKKLLDNQTLEIVSKYICKNVISPELLNLVLYYLQMYPQQISLIPKKLFIHIISNIEEFLHPLVLFLAARHGDIEYNLNFDNLPIEQWAYLMSAFYEKFPLMICDPVFVMNIKNKINTYAMLIDSPQWFNDNGDFFMGLHSIEFDEFECDELFTKLKNDWSIFKITKAAVSFVDLVASKCNKEFEFVQFLITTLFSLPPDNENSSWLSIQIISNLKLLETNCSMKITDEEMDLAVKAIKYGLAEENPEYCYIKVLNKLIKKVNIDESFVKNTFELLVGHSQFINIMLNRGANQAQKEEVLRLIETLMKKVTTLMVPSHIPLYLCSYNASLSVNDQIILRILYLYEEKHLPMSDYRPYLWGSFAISHYQVQSHIKSNTINSFPTTTQMLSYIPLKRLCHTMSNFPVNRILCVKDQKIIRYNMKDNKDPSQMFDPAFFLPMISSLLAAEEPLSIEKFTKKGCLSMILACLGSNDCLMRSAAYHVLTLLRSHLFCRRAENMFWDHFISWVAHGIQNLHFKPPPQLSMIQALFLGRMVLAIANHEKGIDKTCYKILLARPAVRLDHISELKKFLTTFNYAELKDKSFHVCWFFEIIKDGLCSENDWEVFKSMDLFNVILVLINYGNPKERNLILKIIIGSFRILPTINAGAGPLALNFITVMSGCLTELSKKEIILVFQCLQSLNCRNYMITPMIDFWFQIFLECGNDPECISEGFAALNNLVSKYQDDEFKLLFNKEQINKIISHVKETKALSDDELFKCQNILKYGIDGFKIKEKNSYLFLPIMMKII